MFQEYYPENAVVLAIGAYEDESACLGWKERFGLSYPVLADPNGVVSRQFWNNAVPHNAIMDDLHILRFSTAGFGETQVRNTLNTYTSPLVKIDFIPLPNTENTTTHYSINCLIRCNAALVTGSLKIFWNTNGGSTFNESPLTGSGESYSGVIPAQPSGIDVYYYLHAEAVNGKMRNDPNNAPGGLHMFQVIVDTAPPVITHDPIDRWRNDKWSPSIEAQIDDQLPLGAAELQYQINGGSMMSTAMTEEDGMYSAEFGSSVSVGDILTYRIMATDTATTQHTAYHPASGYHTLTVILPIPVAIINLDGNLNSGSIIETTMEALYFNPEYLTALPKIPSLYQSIWICLGVAPNNHQLTVDESNQLLAYLKSGGCAYMEGGNVWFDDTPLPFINAFSVDGMETGAGDLNTILGRASSFAEGLAFTYAGDNDSIDHMRAKLDSFRIFENNDPVYGCGIANAVDNYKTIGVSFEFGGLQDGASPNAKADLLKLYFEFFGIELPDIPTPTPTPAACTNPGVKIAMPSDYFTPGDPCSVTVELCNPNSETYTEVPLFVILDAGGTYFFWPSYSDFDYQEITLAPGVAQLPIITEFGWPDVGEGAGLRWYAAMTNAAINELFGDYSYFDFAWGY